MSASTDSGPPAAPTSAANHHFDEKRPSLGEQQEDKQDQHQQHNRQRSQYLTQQRQMIQRQTPDPEQNVELAKDLKQFQIDRIEELQHQEHSQNHPHHQQQQQQQQQGNRRKEQNKLYEVVDLTSGSTRNMSFRIDSEWVVERARVPFETREGHQGNFEAIVIKKTGTEKKNVSVSMPVRVMGSLYEAIKKIVKHKDRARSDRLPAQLDNVPVEELLESYKKDQQGMFDLTSLVQASYPRTVYRLEGGYLLRVEEIQWNTQRGRGAYDALVISSVKKKKDGGDDQKKFVFNIPLRLLDGLHMALYVLHR